MDKVLSSLHDGMPICNQWNVEKHVLLYTRLPGLLPKVECTPACMACITIDNALSTFVLHLQYFAGDYHVIEYLEHFPLFDAFFHTQH